MHPWRMHKLILTLALIAAGCTHEITYKDLGGGCPPVDTSNDTHDCGGVTIPGDLECCNNQTGFHCADNRSYCFSPENCMPRQ